MSRREAYQWAAGALGISADNCHIGMFDVERCDQIVKLAKAKIKEMRQQLGQPGPTPNHFSRSERTMRLTLIDKDMLRTAIASNTDASEQDAAQIINAVLLKQRKRHSGECEHDTYARDVCEGMWQEKCDDVIGLCEALRAVLALAGENREVRAIVERAIAEHGGPEVA